MPKKKQDRFNLKTMSGIFPGTRTQVFQRVVLGESVTPNAQVAWYDDPAACVVTMDGAEDALLRIEAGLGDVVQRATFWAELVDGLEKRDCPLRACGTCSHWQATAAVTADGLVLGSCNLGNTRSVDQEAARQSVLALACSHWGQQGAQISPSNPPDMGSDETEPTHQMGRPTAVATEPSDPNAQPDGTFSAEEKAEAKAEGQGEIEEPGVAPRKRGGIFSQLKNLFGQNSPPPQPSPQPLPLTERSGVGAGTESCFACQGRIANLGALARQTDEGDAETFSVWRCRVCQTFYLNQWVDRWVRLDNLETEEVYYRLAPSEALALLQEIEAGDGSAKKFMDVVSERSPLSHQIKHGR